MRSFNGGGAGEWAWTNCTAIAPSPTVVAQRLVAPERTSPTANTPETSVSSRLSMFAAAPEGRSRRLVEHGDPDLVQYAGARRLAANGAGVALVARRRERLDEIASAIGSDGGTVLYTREGTTLRMKFASMWDGVAKSPHNATGRWSAHGAAASPSS